MTARAGRSAGTGLAVLVAALWALAAPAAALEEPPGEMEALKACEQRLCSMILTKSPKGADLACAVQKTWAKSSLEGGESKGVSWGFGDARCKADIKLTRADIVAALTKPKHTIRIPPQQVDCVIEREGELKPVKATLAPKLTFKDGKADKVWINLESIDGPADVKSTIWTAAKLEDTLGIFHRPMIKQINKFLFKQCPKRYGPQVAVKAKPVAKKPTEKKPADPKATPAAATPIKPQASKPDPTAAKVVAPATGDKSGLSKDPKPPAKAVVATP